jgi:hypothetical protein
LRDASAAISSTGKLALGEDVQHFAAHVARGARDDDLVAHRALLEPARAAGHRRIAVIGIPCQVYALRRIEAELGFERSP